MLSTSKLSFLFRYPTITALVLMTVGCRCHEQGQAPRPHGAVVEVGFTANPVTASQASFDRLDPSSQWDVVSDIWTQVDRMVPSQVLEMVGTHSIALDERGYPRSEDIRRLMDSLRRAAGPLFDGDPPPAPPCIYDRITGLSIKCGMPLPIELRHLRNGGMPIEFGLNVEIHAVFPRPSAQPAMR
ncbi:MAG: hypothetical protein AB7I19_14640 [Planctomycetota bacterium]